MKSAVSLICILLLGQSLFGAPVPFPPNSSLSTIQKYVDGMNRPLTEDERIYASRECRKIINSDTSNIAARKLAERISLGNSKPVMIAYFPKFDADFGKETREENRISEILGEHCIGWTSAGGRSYSVCVGSALAPEARTLLQKAKESESLRITFVNAAE